MQNTEEADFRAKGLGIGGNLQECLGAGLEQQLEQYLLVLPHERDQRMRDAEHQVIVVYWQQFLLASGQPFIPGVRLALRTMAISAGVVRDRLVSAAFTLVAVSTHRGRPAAFDRVEHLHLRPGEEFLKTGNESATRLTDDISHLPGWPFHRCALPGGATCLEKSRNEIWSRGLMAACKA